MCWPATRSPSPPILTAASARCVTGFTVRKGRALIHLPASPLDLIRISLIAERLLPRARATFRRLLHPVRRPAIWPLPSPVAEGRTPSRLQPARERQLPA